MEFFETVCNLCPDSGKTSNPDRLDRAAVAQGAFLAVPPIVTKRASYLHLAILLVTAGSVASQEVIQGAAWFQ